MAGLLRYEIEVEGAAEATRAIGAVDDAARDAAGGMAAADKAAAGLGRGLGETEDAAKAADKAFKAAAGSAAGVGDAGKSGAAGIGALNDRVKTGLTGFDEMQGRLGQVTNAINLLSGVALVGMVTGIKDAVGAIYEMTEAGKVAKASSEAMTKAIDSAIGKLEGLANAANVSRDALFSLIAAQAAQGEAGAKLREIAAEIQEVQAEYAIQLRDLAIYEEEARQNAYGYSEQAEMTRPIVEKLAKRLVALNAEFDQQKAILSGATRLITENTAAVEKQGQAVAKTAAAQARAAAEAKIQDRQTALIESEGARRLAQLDLRHQRELQAFKGTGEQRKQLVQVQMDEMIALERELERRAVAEREAAAKAELDQRIAMIQRGAAEAAAATQLSMQALLGDPRAGTQEGIDARAKLQRRAAMDAAQAEIQIAQEKGESITQIEQKLQTKLLQIEQDRVAASKQLAEQVKNNIDSVADRIMSGPVQALESFGQGLAQAAVAAILTGDSFAEMSSKALMSLAQVAGTEALMETARGVADLATGTWPPNPAALAAAGEHFTSAGIFAGVAVAAGVAGAVVAPSGGGSAGSAAAPPASSPRDTVSAGDRDRGPAVGGDTYVYFSGGALHTKREVQDTIVRAQDEAGNRRTRRSADLSRIDRSRRRRAM